MAILAPGRHLLYLAQRLIKWYSTNFVITTDRCIYREGIISKRGIEIRSNGSTRCSSTSTCSSGLVRAGDLMIESAGHGGEQRFEDIRNPVMVQNLLYQTMEDNKNRKFDRIRTPAGPGAGGSVADEIAKLAACTRATSPTPSSTPRRRSSMARQPRRSERSSARSNHAVSRRRPLHDHVMVLDPFEAEPEGPRARDRALPAWHFHSIRW